MFILYQSNDFKLLKHMFLYVLKKNKFNNYNNNIILISSSNISLRLKIFFSKYLNVFANYQFLLTAKFVWNLCKIYFSDISDINYFSKINLFFIILNLLPKLIKDKYFLKIKNYLNNDLHYNKLFNLCYKIADLYDKYMVYRPYLLINWEKKILDKEINNDNQIWQSILWKKIINFYLLNFNCKLYRSKILINYLNILKKKNIFKNYYKDIYIFNVYNLPPLYLDIIYFISKYINIHYFIINPSKEYWYDINYFFNINNSLYENNFNLNNINSILLYYAKIFAEYLYIILSYNNLIQIDYYNIIFKKNILNCVKNNILYFDNCKFNLLNKYNLKDNSIIIKCCYGYLDEVYKLRKFLLKLIIKNNYKCKDIIVVVTDIKKYLFYINLVFLGYKYNKIIPYLILDNHYTNDNNIIFKFLLKLLNIKNIDLNLCYFLNLLKNNIILEKFKINDNELDIFLNLIKDISFLRDIKNFVFNKKLFKKYNYTSIIDNIKNLLLGYAINKKFYMWKDIYSYPLLDSDFMYNLIGKFSDLIFKILYWKNVFSKKYFLNKWILLYYKIINDFFSYNLINNYFFLNTNYLNNILYNFKIINFKKKINNLVFIKIINILFKKKKSYKQYSINCINFSSFLPLRSMPYKIICILGMNSNVYPKNTFNYNFDLMYLYPKIGDRNRLENEKYLFMEYFFYSQDIFYVSYINTSLNNNKKYFPSILLDIFINYININIIYLKKFSFVNCKIAIKNKKYLKKYNNKLLNYNFNIIYKNRNIYLKDIHNFWFNPIKYFFNNSLKIFFYENINLNINNYFLNYNIKNFYIFKKKIINNLLIGKKFNKNFYLYLQLFNLIPLGNFGKIIWQKELFNIMKLFNNINKLSWISNEYKFCILIDNNYINGIINLNDKFCHYKYLPKNLNLIDSLIFWINHLIYCALGFNKNSFLYGYNNKFIFKKLDIQLSKYLLSFYIKGFIYGSKDPLLFLPKLSNYIISNMYDFDNNKLLSNYKINNLIFLKLKYLINNKNYLFYDLNDIYINYLIKYNYIKNINVIIDNSKKWLLPMLKYTKIKNY